MSWLTVHLSWMPNRSIEGLRATLERWGVPDHPWARVAYAMFVDAGREGEPVDERVAAMARGPAIRSPHRWACSGPAW